MAFIHTNYLTGNDTTGNGSTSTPYKTVYKAMQVAASNDFIKVAGGQWSANLSGTFTFTQNSNVINTSVSQVGTVLVDDILSFEDGQFGFDKFHIKVLAVTTTTITTCMFWPMATTTVSDVRRIETYHYSSSGTTLFETWSTTDVQPNGRTGITISGGWSNDYTVQLGWTVIRRTGQAIATANSGNGFAFTATGGGLGQWGTDLIWDRFMAHTSFLWLPNAGASGSSFAFKEIALVKGSTNSSQSVYLGIWQADPLVPSVIYNSTPGSNSGMIALNAAQTVNNDRPDVFECDVYATLSTNIAGQANTSAIAAFGMGSAQSREGSINQINLKLRYDNLTLTSNTNYVYYPTSGSIAISGGQYIKSFIFYCNQPGVAYYSLGNVTTNIQDIQLLGPYAPQTGLLPLTSAGQFIVDLEAEGVTIDSLRPMVNFYYNTNYVAYLNYLCQTNLQTVQVRDIEGLKTMDGYNNLYFKTGGVLKIYSGCAGSTNSSTAHAYKLIGVLDKPQVPFTVSFTLRVDAGAEANWDYLAVQYGPNVNQIVEQALTPTDTFANYTINIDPATYTDWTKFSFPIYFGIRSKAANIYASETPSYAYIQSVSVV